MTAAGARRFVALAVAAALLALLAWSTLSSQRAECEVCVTFRGQRNCAAASAASPAEAARSAQATACGPMARDMDASIACERTAPEPPRCRTR